MTSRDGGGVFPYRTALVPLLLLVAFLLLLQKLTAFVFIDEVENMVAATLLAKGEHLYSQVVTHHPPFPMYVLAIFAFFGVKGLVGLRLAFLGIHLAVWIALQLRYRKVVGRMTLPAGMVLFSATAYVHWANRVLYDVFIAYALLAMVCELIRYERLRRLGLPGMLILSGCTFAAVMSGYFSVFPLAVLWATLAARWWREDGGPAGRKAATAGMAAAALAVPFAVLLGAYAMSGILGDYVEQTYELPRRYLEQRPALRVAAETPVRWFTTAWQSVRMLLTNDFTGLRAERSSPPVTAVIALAAWLSNCAVLAYCLVRSGEKRWFWTSILVLATMFAGARKFLWTHAMPYYLLSAFAFVFVAGKWLEQRASRRLLNGLLKAAFSGALVAIVVLASGMKSALRELALPQYPFSPRISSFLREYAAPGDTVWTLDHAYLHYHLAPFDSYRHPSRFPCVYNTYAPHDEEMRDDLRRARPRVILMNSPAKYFDTGYEVFVPLVMKYVRDEYEEIDSGVFVERGRLKRRYEGEGIPLFQHRIVDGGVTPATVIGQEFRAPDDRLEGVSIFLSTYIRKVTTPYEFILKETDSGLVVARVPLKVGEIGNNEFFDVFFPQQERSKGKRYFFALRPLEENVSTPVTLHLGAPRSYFDGTAYLNGKPQDSNYLFRLIFATGETGR